MCGPGSVRSGRAVAPVLVAASLLLGACAALDPLAGLPPGSSDADVTRVLGRPSAVHALPGAAADPPHLQIDTTGRAARRLEYSGGAFGTATRMVDVDAEGRVLASAQVRTPARFNAIRAGMDRGQVLRAIGHPSTIWHLAFQAQHVWAYRYAGPFCEWFQVGIGYDGRVVDTAYGPDPLCDVNRFD